MTHLEAIISRLPYGPDFHFVDRLVSVSEEEIVGEYQFRVDAPWQADHFPDNPIVPGVIITECMAQIGLVCLGLHLYHQQHEGWPGPEGGIAFTESQVKFWHVLRPGESVRVRANKQYYRLGKLKVEAEMLRTDGQRIAKGTLAGILNRQQT